MAYVHIFYVPLLAFGFFANNLLMVAVAHTTPKSLKTYSILIFYEALNDLFVIISDGLAFERLIVKLPSFTYVALGPCRLISGDLCNYCNSIMTSGLVQSIVLQSISFGYRNYILTRPSPSSRAIHVVVVVATLPNNLHLVLFKHVKVSDPQLFATLSQVYPATNWTGATYYGIPRLHSAYPAILFGAFFVIIPALFAYILFTRIRLLRKLRSMSKCGKLSTRTVKLHKTLVKILTIHALLPLSMIFALIGIGLLVAQIYSPELEAVAYAAAMVAPVASPAVTILLLTPYRRFVVHSLLRLRAKLTVAFFAIQETSKVDVVTVA